MKASRILGAIVIAAAMVAALGGNARAATISNGTKILCVMHKGVSTQTLTPGTDFKLHVDDPGQPALTGAVVVGHVTDVMGPGGLARASISFVFDYIQFASGKKEPIHASVVGKNVVSNNTAQLRKEQVKFSLPAMPVGTVTPGPVAWQMHFKGNGSPSVTPAPGGNSGGVVYAQNTNEQIVIPPGAPVTLQLTADLQTP